MLYHGVYGQSRKISEFVRDRLTADGHSAVVRPLADGAADAADFDAIVIGASIRHGKHKPLVVDFVRAQLGLL